jgi:2-polyprenyl-3-methyl-5-hydroxy-6-metoxy-1,4-benzoquinol methylase
MAPEENQLHHHWNEVYSSNTASSLSWYQDFPEHSLRQIQATGLAPSAAAVIDVGGGASKLVDALLLEGYHNPTVLDCSECGLEIAKQRLGNQAQSVNWILGNILETDLPRNGYNIWHDRAVFHFLIHAHHRDDYLNRTLHAVSPGGHLIITTFAEDGPGQCSGLPVIRYNLEQMQQQFAPSFSLLSHGRELHRTPNGAVQSFLSCHFHCCG